MKQIKPVWLQDDSGQDLVEYALVAGLLALAAVASVKSVGTGVTTVLNKLSTTLTTNV